MKKTRWKQFKETVKLARKMSKNSNGWRINAKIVIEQEGHFFNINPFLVNLSKGSYIPFEFCLNTGKKEVVKNIKEYI